MDEAAVLAECAANPDDDAPRLVWADLVGGERGELVVLQCDLARGDLPPAEAAARRRRERELLDAHAIEWAGPLATIATRWSFRRGFVETARLEAFDPAHVAGHPLLATVTLDEGRTGLLERIAPHVRLRGLAVDGTVDALAQVARSPIAGELRALSIEDLRPEGHAAALALVGRAPLEQLWLRRHQLEPAQVEALIAAAPRVTAIFVEGGSYDDRALVIDRPLRALRADHIELRSLGATIEALRVNAPAGVGERIARLAGLRVLSIGHGDPSELLRDLARRPPLPALRMLRIELGVDRSSLRALVAHYGAQLELLELPFGEARELGLAIAGEVRVGPPASYRRSQHDVLLHHDPSTLLVLDVPSCARSQPAAIARVDGEPVVWDIAPTPAEEQVFVGRMLDSHVQIKSTSISKRHCSLRWLDGRHVIRDHGSTNGVVVDRVRVEQAPLADGAELQLGSVILRYFVGPGAHDRAAAALDAVKTVDVFTRLPIDATPARTVTIANYEQLRAQRYAGVEIEILRAVAGELAWFAAGEPIAVVRPGVFGVQAATAARIGRRSLTVTVDNEPIEVELVSA